MNCKELTMLIAAIVYTSNGNVEASVDIARTLITQVNNITKEKALSAPKESMFA